LQKKRNFPFYIHITRIRENSLLKDCEKFSSLGLFFIIK